MFVKGDNYDYCHGSYLTNTTYTVPPATDTLKLVQVVTRHGARTPVNLLKNKDSALYSLCPSLTIGSLDSVSIYRSYQQLPLLSSVYNPYTQLYWNGNCLTGQLTNKGISQHVELGAALREVYVDQLKFLDGLYDPEASLLFTRSTDVWRTKQSAQSLLTGLYGFAIPDDADTVPYFPIHTYPSELETMYGNSLCPSYVSLMNNITNSDAYKAHMDENRDFLMHLARAAEMEQADASWFSSFDHFFDQTHVRYCHGLPLHCNSDKSECITQDDVTKLGELVDWEYQYTYQNFDRVKSSRLGISSFLNELLSIARSHKSKDNATALGSINQHLLRQAEAKFLLYSGHDTTIGPLLGALSVPSWRVPPYATSFILELWERKVDSQPTKWYFRVINNGQIIQLPWCGGVDECDFDLFDRYVTELIPTDLLKECGL